jgi:LuxR family maltose regulon positive regulatory protein
MFLIEHLPPGVHVVLSSRADPPLPLARLRGRGQLVELRAAELRFTVDEAAHMLRDALGPDVRLPDTAFAALTDRTEGWAAGLQLAGLSLRGRPDVAAFIEAFSGSHRYVLDYLTEEVLERQPEALRTFLLETSVLDRLSGPLCDAVTGRSDSQAMLEAIERANLFLVPLDEVRGWWRYHQLFADLLRARLQQESPLRVTELHRHAAAWFDEHGLADDAVHHAQAAGEVRWVANLIERFLDATVLRSGEATVRTWLAALPTELIESRPRLLLAQAMLGILDGDLEGVEGLLDAAESASSNAGDEPYEPSVGASASVLVNVPAMIALVRSSLAELRGDAEGTRAFARQALAEIGDDAPMLGAIARLQLGVAAWLSGWLDEAERAFAQHIDDLEDTQPTVAAWASHELGRMLRDQGRLSDALATYQRTLEFTAPPGRPGLPAAGIAHVGLAEIQFELNELGAAERHAIEGIALCRQITDAKPLAIGLATLARIRLAGGDPAGAQTAIVEALAVAPGSDVVNLLNPVPALGAQLRLVQGDVEAAADWAKERNLGVDDEPGYARQGEYLVLARVLIAGDQPGQASRLLDRLLGAATEQGRFGSAIEIHCLRALAHAARDDEDGALDALAEAVTLAAPQGWLRVFVDEGQPMAALLARLVAKRGRDLTRAGVSLGYVSRLGAAMEPESARGASPGDRLVESRSATIPGLIEALSERELEVLHLIAAGKANREIADELFVTLDPVKKHTTHILGKLGATNRTEAAAHARELGLIP